jgi:aminoglycoside phosphotransferase (APT) family kinase protein
MVPPAGDFQHWLRALPGFADAVVESLATVDGGASNVTCRAMLAGAPTPSVVLRLQRERGIFEPYDVIREGEVVRRLAQSRLPVPRLLGGEPDPGVLGAPFIVLDWIDAPHMGNAPGASFAAYTEAVVAVHNVDWRALGLGFMGVPASPRDALIAEVDAFAARMPAFGCEHDALLVRALDSLRRNAPNDGRLALCQGDINIFNYLFRGAEVVGVVDWEQARISDPRSDVGQLVTLSHLKGAPFGPANQQNFVLAYGAAAGASLAGMEFFRAQWLFQLGVIYHGWMKFNDSEPWYSLAQLHALLDSALAELD